MSSSCKPGRLRAPAGPVLCAAPAHRQQEAGGGWGLAPPAPYAPSDCPPAPCWPAPAPGSGAALDPRRLLAHPEPRRAPAARPAPAASRGNQPLVPSSWRRATPAEGAGMAQRRSRSQLPGGHHRTCVQGPRGQRAASDCGLVARAPRRLRSCLGGCVQHPRWVQPALSQGGARGLCARGRAWQGRARKALASPERPLRWLGRPRLPEPFRGSAPAVGPPAAAPTLRHTPGCSPLGRPQAAPTSMRVRASCAFWGLRHWQRQAGARCSARAAPAPPRLVMPQGRLQTFVGLAAAARLRSRQARLPAAMGLHPLHLLVAGRLHWRLGAGVPGSGRDGAVDAHAWGLCCCTWERSWAAAARRAGITCWHVCLRAEPAAGAGGGGPPAAASLDGFVGAGLESLARRHEPWASS